MKMLIFILALVVYSRAFLKIDLGGKGSVGPKELKARVDYLKNKKSVVGSTVDNVSKFTVTITQAPVDTSTVQQLEVQLYAKNTAGLSVNPPGFTSEIIGGNQVLTIPYNSNQLTDFYGCRELPFNPTYIGKICDFTLDYVASELGVVLATDIFSVTVKIPKQGSSTMTVNAKKIFNDLCDCEVLGAYPLMVQVFIDSDCTKPLVGSEVTLGQKICMKLTTTNNLASTYDFETRSVLMTYYDAAGAPKTQEMITLSEIVDGKGTSKINIEVLSTGDSIMFTNTVLLKNSRRMLGGNRVLIDDFAGKGLQGNSQSLLIKKTFATSSASSIGISLTMILLVILAILV